MSAQYDPAQILEEAGHPEAAKLLRALPPREPGRVEEKPAERPSGPASIIPQAAASAAAVAAAAERAEGEAIRERLFAGIPSLRPRPEGEAA